MNISQATTRMTIILVLLQNSLFLFLPHFEEDQENDVGGHQEVVNRRKKLQLTRQYGGWILGGRRGRAVCHVIMCSRSAPERRSGTGRWRKTPVLACSSQLSAGRRTCRQAVRLLFICI